MTSRMPEAIEVLRTIVETAQGNKVLLGLLPAKHRVTGEEVILLVLESTNDSKHPESTVTPLAVVLNSVEAVDQFIPLGEGGAYDEEGKVWEARKPLQEENSQGGAPQEEQDR